MKKKYLIFLVLVFFLAIGSAFAEGNFTQLSDEIDTTPDIFQFSQDYIFTDDETYNASSPIVIGEDNYVIEGNNFIVDGQNKARVFAVYGNNVTINNLNIINTHYSKEGSGIWVNGSVILNNVTFTNNNATQGGAIYSAGSVICNNVYFIDSYADRGSAIYSKGNLTISDSYFTSKNPINYASIYGLKANLEVYDTVFENIDSKYATAIFNRYGNTTIQRSKFYNLNARETAGAIGIRELVNFTMNSCEFINVTSSKNGGAMYVDVYGEFPKAGDVELINSTFINCSSDFGGAFLQLGGMLSMKNITFINNTATYKGGSCYLSLVAGDFGNVSFISNNVILDDEYPAYGGAIYLDGNKQIMGKFAISNSKFIANEANNGGAIYMYDSSIDIRNTQFLNNDEAVHAVFAGEINFEDCDFSNDTCCLNDTDYVNVIAENGMELILVNNTINVVNLPTRFDLRDFGWVSPVRSQGAMGACWAFGMTGTLESAFLKATGIETDFSENNMQNSMLIYSPYGVSILEGAQITEAVAYLVSWLGAFPQAYDTYDELGKISPSISTGQNVHIQDFMFIPRNLSEPGDHAMKEAILKYGSLAGYYFGDARIGEANPYYNPQYFSHYCNVSTISNHAISIVGWDDTFSADKFLITPPGDGAWIIKNSWGEDYGDKGYMYISYYDLTLCAFPDLIEECAGAIILENTIPYNKNYQYDFGGLSAFRDIGEDISYKNVFEAIDNDVIAAVGTYFNKKDVDYTIEIYVNGELKYVQEGLSPFYGYATIKLDEYIPICKGDIFEAVMTSNACPCLTLVRQHVEEGSSFCLNDGEWSDLSANKSVACLKVYTLPIDIITHDLVKIYKNDSKFEANIGVANETVTFEINSMNYTRTSDENGIANIAINLLPGEYIIKTTYENTTVENNIIVLSTLIAQNLVKYFRNDSQFFIDLIDGEGNPLVGQNISMNINGVFYTRTTNENGTARLNINLNPGVYVLTAIDPVTGLQMAYNITVLPTLIAEDINMTFQDGTKFTAKLVDGEGNALVNVAVSFNINGVLYERFTDSKGIASLNINLMPGKYIITSKYGDAVVSNTITIQAKD